MSSSIFVPIVYFKTRCCNLDFFPPLLHSTQPCHAKAITGPLSKPRTSSSWYRINIKFLSQNISSLFVPRIYFFKTRKLVDNIYIT